MKICKETPQQVETILSEKIKNLFASLQEKLARLAEKILRLLAAVIRIVAKYWNYLMIPSKILIMILKKAKKDNWIDCEAN